MNDMNEDNIAKWTKIKEESFKALGRVRGDKGMIFETNYSIAYDKLTLMGKGQRLRGKYRAR